MKVIVLIGILAGLGFASAAQAKSKCYGGHERKGYQDLVDTFHRKRDYVGFASKFREFCEVNRDLVSCEQMVLPQAEINAKAIAYSTANQCGETFSLPPDGNKTATLYAFTEKAQK